MFGEKDSFIWKNKSSINNGIIVTSLPSIVKPPLRFETVEIDGRDGDITNLLGYSSYIKKLELAFIQDKDDYFNAILENILEWLTGEDRIIFSNESDKYYDGIIINQVDYEKVLKFRKAILNIKVQPFKYSVKEYKLEKNTFFSVYNTSNLPYLPVITIMGDGIIHFLNNGIEICQVNIDERITLDSVLQDAYKDNNNNLANRRMLGEFPIFKSGKNDISWYGEGTVDKIQVSYRKGWL